MNAMELVKDLLHFVWDAVLNWAQTPEGSATLAEIVSDFGLGDGEPAPANSPAQPVKAGTTLKQKPTAETEAERQARMGVKVES